MQKVNLLTARTNLQTHVCTHAYACIRTRIVVCRVGILRQLSGTPPQLLKHHPIESWGFWDNFLEHHPNFRNTTPSSRGDYGTTFWNTTPTFENTTPSAQQREHQPARVTVLVQLFRTPGPPTRPRATPYMVRVLVQPLEHHPAEPQGQTSILDHFSMAGGTQAKNADKSIDTPLRARPTDPQQCFSLHSLQTWSSGAKHVRARPTLIEPLQGFSLPSLQDRNKTCLDPPHPSVSFTLFF